MMRVQLVLLFVVNFQACVTIEAGRSAASIGVVGDINDVTRSTTGGNMLAGGGPDVDEAFRWMIKKSGGGDFVVIRATGTDAYNSYIYSLGSVNSVETLLINSRALANDPQVEATIRSAEAVFIAGGNQANYVNFWKDTKVEDALNYLRNVKQVPIGGTSAGCAILGGSYFSALYGTITTAEALANPYDRYMTIGHDDFLNQPYLKNVITDTHFDNPDRRGRLITFMARMNQDYGVIARGIGVDENTAVCIESDGKAQVFGTGLAFFLIQNGVGNEPETCRNGSPLDWFRRRQAIKAWKISGSSSGTGTFDTNTWTETSSLRPQYYYIDRGVLGISQ